MNFVASVPSPIDLSYIIVGKVNALSHYMSYAVLLIATFLLNPDLFGSLYTF